jgi:hypothetical protein
MATRLVDSGLNHAEDSDQLSPRAVPILLHDVHLEALA